jgi:8-oxo-dGTP diphosphatase
LDILDRHEKLFLGGSHKAPYLYSFKKKSSDSF